LVALGVVCAVVLPTALLVAVGATTGGPMRGQDPWLAEVAYAGAAPLVDEAHPPLVREAWSASFRQEPPAALVPFRKPTPGALVGRVLAAIGLRDPRPLLVVALLAAAAVAAWLVRPWALLAMAVVALSPALAAGVALGAPDAIALLAILAVFALVANTRIAKAAALLIAVAWIAPAVAEAPSLGLGGLLAYVGAEGSRVGHGLLPYLVIAALLLLPQRWPRPFGAAVAWLALLWLWGPSALWLGAPVALLALAAVEQGDLEPAAA
jgi:hypothetical protein